MISANIQEGREHNNIAESIVCIRSKGGSEINLVTEVISQARRLEKQAKVKSAINVWLPAISETDKYAQSKFLGIDGLIC